MGDRLHRLSRLGLAAVAVLAAAPAPAQPPPEEILGAPSAFDLSTAQSERVTLPAGTRLYERPALQSGVLATLDADVELEVLARGGAWFRVRFGTLKVWALARDQAAPVATAAPPPIDPARLERAQSILGAAGRWSTLGPFRLLTDVPAGTDLERLSRVAAAVPEAYRLRYALTAPPRAEETVVLFSRGEAYRRYSAAEPDLVELESQGHAGGGLAVLALGRQDELQITALLLHELTHLLNRRALGNDLPPWLDEGMAEDLAYSRVDRRGRLELGSLAGRFKTADVLATDPLAGARTSRVVSVQGPRVQLKRLLDAWAAGRRPSLAELVDQSWGEIVDPVERAVHYAESAFLLRYLLDGGNAAHTAALRAYLAAVAGGGPSDGDALQSRLGQPWETTELALHGWLENQAAAEMLASSRSRP